MIDFPDREQVTTVLMNLYQWTFWVVFGLAVVTVGYCIWHLIPKKEY